MHLLEVRGYIINNSVLGLRRYIINDSILMIINEVNFFMLSGVNIIIKQRFIERFPTKNSTGEK